jgi:DNA-binding phage protein
MKKRILLTIIGFMMCLFAVNAEKDSISRQVAPRDSVTVTFRMPKDQLASETQTTLLTNVINTNNSLSTNIGSLTDAIKQNLELSRESRMDKIAKELNVSKDSVYRAIKHNTMFKLIALIPFLLVVLWGLYSFLTQKGLSITHAMIGTGLVTVLSALGALALYFVLSLLFNDLFFTIRGLMFSS